jgi:hypothetical protein
MKSKKWFIFCVCVCIFGGTVNSAVADTADQIHFTVISNTAMTFDWIGTADHIYYGTDPANLVNSVVAVHPPFLPVIADPWTSNAGPYWEAKLTGLQQNTIYSYKIGDSGQVKTFLTPPPRGVSGFRTCSVSDLHNNSTECLAMFDQIVGLNPDFVITTGDTTGGDSGGQSYVDTRFHTAMAWSQEAAWMPIWGNHDWQDNPSNDDLRTLKGRFDIANPQTAYGSPTPGCCDEDWGWFDYGNVRFISCPERYNSSYTWQNWETAAKPIFAAAQNDPNIKFIVTLVHQSPWTSTVSRYPGSSTQQAIWNRMRASYSKYVLDLSGHNHNYERYQLSNGLTTIINSTCGAYYRAWASPTKPTNCAYRAIHYGILVLDFSANAIQGQYICSVNTSRTGTDYDVEEDVCGTPNQVGMVIDSFTIGTPDSAAPTPNPMTWASAPAAIDETSIGMTATTATDGSGVEYFFQNTTAGMDSHNSGWQLGTSWTDTGLDAGTTYTYQVKARDKSPTNNETAVSTPPALATTLGGGIAGDLDGSGAVDMLDFVEFAAYWLEDDCAAPDWCGGANLTQPVDNTVDFSDLNILVGNWLEGVAIE